VVTLRPSFRPGALPLILAAALTLAGCAGPVVSVPVAPEAHHPDCARIVLALPEVLDGQPRHTTSSQATRAWGDPRDAVTLRCGVPVPAPTTQTCTTADDLRGHAVDWVSVEDASGWTFTTYGRHPAVEVFVPATVAAQRSTSFLLDLGPAVSQVPATRACIGLTDF